MALAIESAFAVAASDIIWIGALAEGASSGGPSRGLAQPQAVAAISAASSGAILMFSMVARPAAR